MKKVTKEYEVYKFRELSPEVKQKVIDKWYEAEDYPFLKDDLEEILSQILADEKIEAEDGPELYYSLSCCQGDGACFTGKFEYKGRYVLITHRGHYYHSRSVDFEFMNEEGELLDDDENFMELYRKICAKIEKEGYKILEYRMDFSEFEEYCEENEFEFLKNGEMFN